MSGLSDYRFSLRWKEEAVCDCALGRLVFECTMGTVHLYFPDEEAWRRQAPAWARDRWAEVHRALQVWCNASRLPMTVDAKAWVVEEAPT